MNALVKSRRFLGRIQIFSPVGFFAMAALILGAFAIAHGLGLRRFTSVLSGSPPEAAMSIERAVSLGMMYALSYFATIIAVPVLVIAATVFKVIKWKILRPRAGQSVRRLERASGARTR